MKKHTSKSGPAIEHVRTFSKPALGECTLILASTLLRAGQTRGQFDKKREAAAARDPVAASFDPDALELIGEGGRYSR